MIKKEVFVITDWQISLQSYENKAADATEKSLSGSSLY